MMDRPRVLCVSRMAEIPTMVRLLDVKEVCRRLNVSRSTLYKMIAAGQFPPPLRLPGGAPRWREDDVDGWIDGLGHDRAPRP